MQRFHLFTSLGPSGSFGGMPSVANSAAGNSSSILFSSAITYLFPFDGRGTLQIVSMGASRWENWSELIVL